MHVPFAHPGPMAHDLAISGLLLLTGWAVHAAVLRRQLGAAR